nr:uncharacterized protein LOC127320968 [Lolium perenne]
MAAPTTRLPGRAERAPEDGGCERALGDGGDCGGKSAPRDSGGEGALGDGGGERTMENGSGKRVPGEGKDCGGDGAARDWRRRVGDAAMTAAKARLDVGGGEHAWTLRNSIAGHLKHHAGVHPKFRGLITGLAQILW